MRSLRGRGITPVMRYRSQGATRRPPIAEMDIRDAKPTILI